MNWEIANKLKEEGYITIQEHPDCDLFILNYTPKCQYEGKWDENTMQCRGLIVNSMFEVQARPFKKFFNWSEHVEKESLPDVHWDPLLIQEKMDGSLGILYWCGKYGKSEPRIATRGSFTSDQALRATEMLRQIPVPYTKLFSEGFTYLFEIIYPENRIVVDYGKVEELVLLSVIHTRTGTELGPPGHDVFRIPKVYDPETPAEELLKLFPDDGNTEGAVVLMKDGTRVKIKTAEYVRLHRIITQVSNKSIWEFLKDGIPLDDILERVPDEFYDWVKAVKLQLETQFEDFYQRALTLQTEVHDMERKDAAAIILQVNKTVASATFAMLDGKDAQAAQAIWKAIKPEYSRPFKQDIDS